VRGIGPDEAPGRGRERGCGPVCARGIGPVAARGIGPVAGLAAGLRRAPASAGPDAGRGIDPDSGLEADQSPLSAGVSPQESDSDQELDQDSVSPGRAGRSARGIGPVTGRNEGRDWGPPAGPDGALGNGPVPICGIGPDG